jgi:hypothetical protein
MTRTQVKERGYLNQHINPRPNPFQYYNAWQYILLSSGSSWDWMNVSIKKFIFNQILSASKMKSEYL